MTIECQECQGTGFVREHKKINTCPVCSNYGGTQPRPEVVTLCGSPRFKEAYEREAKRLTLEGKIVISVGMLGHQEGLDMEAETKKMLDELHLRKIDLSDSIHVLNVQAVVCKTCGKPCHVKLEGSDPFGPLVSVCCTNPVTVEYYVGSSTRNEIAYAKKTGKKITYLNSVEGE